jgi:hypothetical protein
MISEHEHFQLKQMLEHSNFVDHTDEIRNVKHSEEIQRCVLRILELKRDHGTMTPIEFDNMVMLECSFLFRHYMELYNIIIKEDIDTTLMLELLNVLKQIEHGDLSQHEGSFLVGKRLKEIYIDSKLKKTIASDEIHRHEFKPHLKMSWKDFKNNIIPL